MNAVDASELYSQVCDRHKWLRDKWLNEAEKIQEIYQGDKGEETPFNILYSNTEILVPSIFSKAPIPVVKRRHDEQRADLPAKASERFLSYVMDTNLAGYPAFVDALEASVLDAALPGLGQVRVRLVNGIPQLDYVHFDSFVWGYARRWEQVPWIAYKLDLTKADIQKQFKKSDLDMAGFRDEGIEETDGSDKSAKDATYPVYEIWDKASRTVRFVCDHYKGSLLLEQTDPLGLEGFFDCPQPLVFVLSTGDLRPRPLYNLYKQQAEELNAVTMRIKRVTQAIRVRGIYNGNLPEVAKLLKDGELENQLIPADKPSIMTNEGGIDKQIWLLPIEKLIVVLQQLFVIREQVKQTIYEILGIADILRGVSQASETLGAQQIKDKWGSLRINKMREKTARFVRSGLRLLLEVGAKHTPEEVWAQATGMQLATAVQALVLQQSGQPAPPSWPQVLGTLKNDIQRSYIIDIESNSTVDSDATQDKQDIAEFMQAMGQALQGLAPLAQQGPEGFEATKAIMLEFIKKFRMGPEIQRILEKLPPPPKPQVPPEIQEQIEKKTQELDQREQQAAQREEQVNNQSTTVEQQIAKLQKMAQDLEVAQKKLDLARETVQKEIALDAREADLQVRESAMKVSADALAVKNEKQSVAGERQALQVAGEKVAVEGSRVAQSKELVGAQAKEVQAQSKEVQEKESGLAELKPLLQALIEATQANIETTHEVLATLKSRGKAKFTQSEDGSVLKEYLQ
jgi:hypothetical protein